MVSHKILRFETKGKKTEYINIKDDVIAFVKESSGKRYDISATANSSVKYDLVGKLVDETGLTRKAIVAILQGIQPVVFSQFKNNPEEFILKAAALIND